MTRTGPQAMKSGGRHVGLAVRVRELFADVTGLDISTADGADNAMVAMDAALKAVNDARAEHEEALKEQRVVW